MKKILLALTLSQRSPHNLLNDCIVFQELVVSDVLAFSQRLARDHLNDCIVFLALVEHVMLDQHDQKITLALTF